jgi:predicted nucleic acid-binding protein
VEVISLLVDTNAYTAFWKSDRKIAAIFEFADRLIFPFISIGELLAGFRLGNREQENRNRLDDLLSLNRAEILYPDRQTAECYASIFSELRKKGTPIPTNDIWIAALARQYQFPLCSYDSDFESVNDLVLVRRLNDLKH